MQSCGGEIEGFGGGEIDARLRLVVAGEFGAEDGIPGKIVAPRQIDHDGNIAVRQRRQEIIAPKTRQAGRHVGPGVEPVPGEVESAAFFVAQRAEPEARQDAIEVAPVQHVELAEPDAAGAHLFHGALIFVAPGIRQGRPVERIAARLEHRLGLARNPAAPIDQRAEDVEQQRFHGDHASLLAQAPPARNSAPVFFVTAGLDPAVHADVQ